MLHVKISIFKTISVDVLLFSTVMWNRTLIEIDDSVFSFI